MYVISDLATLTITDHLHPRRCICNIAPTFMSSAIGNIPSRLMPLRLPRICVAVSGSNPAELLDKAEAVARDNPFVEFRLDYLKAPLQALPRIKSFLGSHTYVSAIATCRRAVAGGKFKGSIASELDVLIKAGQAGCHF